MTVSEKPLRLPMVMKAGRIAAELGLGPAIRSLPLSPAMSRRYQELASAESHKPRCGLQHTELGGAVPERKRCDNPEGEGQGHSRPLLPSDAPGSGGSVSCGD